ncbi:hypothetical protein E1265_26760 [Streptomyces sp. 8K308]|uniref:hypothetical protein n=1 Tax=Streptomyces sp. 8K308 TaxID=2530388 RepID=UPI001044F4B2|nr:hypothetical protein [Streptomyces sp. 8K308]TDC15440.1 hypothetical protein E1265_26760 [Streptomyces sp. 8K308]
MPPRTAPKTADRREQADGRLADAACLAGFDGPRAAAEAALPEAERARPRRRADAWRAERAAISPPAAAYTLNGVTIRPTR